MQIKNIVLYCLPTSIYNSEYSFPFFDGQGRGSCKFPRSLLHFLLNGQNVRFYMKIQTEAAEIYICRDDFSQSLGLNPSTLSKFSL